MDMIATTNQLNRVAAGIDGAHDFTSQRVNTEAQTRATVDGQLQEQLNRIDLHLGLLVRHLGLAFEDGVRVVKVVKAGGGR